MRPLLFATVLAATIAAFALTQAMRSQPAVLDEVELSPSFRPEDGHRATIRFRLTREDARVTVEVIDAEDDTVATVIEDQPLGDYEIHRFRWDGRTDRGEIVAPGRYGVRVILGELDRRILLPGQIRARRGRDDA